MKAIVSKKPLLQAYLWLLIAVLAYTFIMSLFKGYTQDSWSITEFLINYQGGFVRRGLLGECLLQLYRNVGIHPYILIVGGSAIAYLILVIFFIKGFRTKGYPLFILPFSFFLGNPIVNDFWVRKDVLMVLIFIVVLYFANKESKRSLLFVNLFFILGLLITENIGFFCFPILFLVLTDRNRKEMPRFNVRSMLLSIMQLIPSVLVFLSVLFFKGTKEVAVKIWNSWETVPFPYPPINNVEIPAAIGGISWSIKEGLGMFLNTLRNFSDSIYAPMAWIVILAVLYFLLTNVNSMQIWRNKHQTYPAFDKTVLSNVLLLQLLSVLPLFFVGWDYGRWVFFWVTSSFALMVLTPEYRLARLFPTFISNWNRKLNAFMNGVFSKSTSFLWMLCLLVGVPLYSWKLSYFVETTSVFMTLGTLSKWLHDLLLVLKGWIL